MYKVIRIVFEPGFFNSTQVCNALWVGTAIALTSAVFGVFVIIRKQTFVGHAVSDFGGAGAAMAFLFSINTILGFLVFGTISALGVEIIGNRTSERDVVTGVVLSLALGTESLFLFLDTHFTGHAGAPMMILFGSVFIIKSSLIPLILIISIVCLVVLLMILRPIILCSVSPEISEARGIPVKSVGIIFVTLLVLVVDQSSIAIGTLLSTALLIGPAASAMKLTSKLGNAIFYSSIFGIFSMWVGVILAYDSYYWFSSHQSWPVSFFVCFLLLFFYLLTSGINCIRNKYWKGKGF